MTKGYAVRISFQSHVVLPKLSLIGPYFFHLFPIWYGGFLLCRRGGIAREKAVQGQRGVRAEAGIGRRSYF